VVFDRVPLDEVGCSVVDSEWRAIARKGMKKIAHFTPVFKK
jgi:uncharacterized membrane protein YjdF